MGKRMVRRTQVAVPAVVKADVDAGTTPIDAGTSVSNPLAGSLIENNSGLYRWIFGILKTLVGLPLCFFGLRWWKWNGLVSGVVAGMMFGNFIEKMVMTYYVYTDLLQWVWLGVIVALCVVFAIGFRCWKRCGSAFMGGLVGLIAYNLTISIISACRTDFALPEWWLQMVIMGCAVGFGFFMGCFFKKTIVIISTAVAGGYTFVSGVGTLVGRFPEPYMKIEGWVWWSWLAGAFVFMILGMFVQCCTYKKQEESEEHGHATIHLD